jgi:allophanate hydrolase
MQAFEGIGPAPRAVEYAYERMAALHENPAFIHVVPRAQALARAHEVARCEAALPLAGVPFAVKDNINVGGLPTTAACPAFAYQAEHTAFVVRRLLDAGAILVGKTNLDQFATGLVGTRSPYGACRNVFDARYISGGSSSGSAVAVAAGVVPFALGTDTAGSGRVPAALNGLVGLKPTRGRLSTAGVVPACRSLDCVSILARTVAQALAVFDVSAGFDPADPFSRQPRDLPLDCARIAVPRDPEFFGDAGYERLFVAAIGRMQALGARIEDIDFEPFLEVQALLYDGPWLAERVAAIGEFMAAQPHALHPVTRSVIGAGTKYSAVDAFRAQYRLEALRRRCQEALEGAQVLMVPGAPSVYTVAQVEAHPLELNARLGLYTNFANLLDLAGITIPAGRREDGMPFGVTLLGPAFTDRALAALAARFLGEAIEGKEAIQGPASVRLAVVGAHLSGMPLNHELAACGARLVRTARTAPSYRLYALAGQKPAKPGLLRTATGCGAAIEVEVWELGTQAFGSFVAGIAAPLGIGTLELEDGEQVKGFLCEAYAIDGREDITAFGGWRRYLQSTS